MPVEAKFERFRALEASYVVDAPTSDAARLAAISGNAGAV
jgi:hypothetical protein